MLCVLSNRRKKRGDFYSILSGPSHKNSSFHFGTKVLFVRRLKHTHVFRSPRVLLVVGVVVVGGPIIGETTTTT